MANSNDTSDTSERLLEFFERQAIRIPEPIVYTGVKGSIGIKDFFTKFERYCDDRYRKDLVSWLQILPNYLKGEAELIVAAFGYDAEYGVGKAKLLVN